MYFWKYIRNKFLGVIWLLMVALPAMGLVWIKENHPDVLPSVVMWVIIPGYLFYVASTFYLLNASIHHMDEDPLISFREAVKLSFDDFRLLMRFVPVIGSLFEPDEDKTHYDPDDDVQLTDGGRSMSPESVEDGPEPDFDGAIRWPNMRAVKAWHWMVPLLAVAIAAVIVSLPRNGNVASDPKDIMNFDPAVVMKIIVRSDGSVLVDGEATDLESIPAKLAVLRERKGVIWYYRANPDREPPPNSTDLFKMIMDARCSISFFMNEDFSVPFDPGRKPATSK